MDIKKLSYVQILCKTPEEIKSIADIMEEYGFLTDLTREPVKSSRLSFITLINSGLETQLFIESPMIYGGYTQLSTADLFAPQKYTPITYEEFMGIDYFEVEDSSHETLVSCGDLEDLL